MLFCKSSTVKVGTIALICTASCVVATIASFRVIVFVHPQASGPRRDLQALPCCTAWPTTSCVWQLRGADELTPESRGRPLMRTNVGHVHRAQRFGPLLQAEQHASRHEKSRRLDRMRGQPSPDVSVAHAAARHELRSMPVDRIEAELPDPVEAAQVRDEWGNHDVLRRCAQDAARERLPEMGVRCDASPCAVALPHNMAARTTIHSRNTVMLMRSQSPIQGVGRFACRRGASRNVNPPNARSTTLVPIEYRRNRFPNAAPPNPIARNMRSTVTPPRTTCRVSLHVAPPAASTSLWCIAANGHSNPSEAWARR